MDRLQGAVSGTIRALRERVSPNNDTHQSTAPRLPGQLNPRPSDVRYEQILRSSTPNLTHLFMK